MILTTWLLTATVFFISPAMAQVTIGVNETPSQNALLDLKQNSSGTSTKGLLLPRVSLQSTSSASPMAGHEKGMFIYNTATTNTGTNDVTPGIYYNDGTQWIMAGAGLESPVFFYMPAFLLPVDISDSAYDPGTQTFSINLYTEYTKQFNLMGPSTKNLGAASLPIYTASELDYFITYFDNAVFSNVTVNSAGLMTYKLVNNPVFSEKTFMNILFQVK